MALLVELVVEVGLQRRTAADLVGRLLYPIEPYPVSKQVYLVSTHCLLQDFSVYWHQTAPVGYY